MAENGVASWIREKVTAAVVIAFLLGVVLGLVVLGWYVWPVRWTNAAPADLSPHHQAIYLEMVADSYELAPNTGLARARLETLKSPGEKDADLLLRLDAQAAKQTTSGNVEGAARLRRLASEVIGQPVEPGITPATQPSVTTSSQVLRIVAILFFLLLLGAGIVLLLMQLQRRESLRRRRQSGAGQPSTEAPHMAGESVAHLAAEGALGHFETTYQLGDEGYDVSYSIETSAGEFLGECGISALEMVGIGDPERVTAFEIWLFDKDDVRTETRVLMSERAFGDDALRSKLANKGEVVQVEEGQIVSLETANLRLDATLIELLYESGSNSGVFAKLTTGLEVSHRQGVV